MCVLTAPKVFIFNAFGLSSVLDPEGDSEAGVVVVAAQCSLSAITVEDVETGKQLFPFSISCQVLDQTER